MEKIEKWKCRKVAIKNGKGKFATIPKIIFIDEKGIGWDIKINGKMKKARIKNKKIIKDYGIKILTVKYNDVFGYRHIDTREGMEI